jgi:hypothetical protein
MKNIIKTIKPIIRIIYAIIRIPLGFGFVLLGLGFITGLIDDPYSGSDGVYLMLIVIGLGFIGIGSKMTYLNIFWSPLFFYNSLITIWILLIEDASFFRNMYDFNGYPVEIFGTNLVNSSLYLINILLVPLYLFKRKISNKIIVNIVSVIDTFLTIGIVLLIAIGAYYYFLFKNS